MITVHFGVEDSTPARQSLSTNSFADSGKKSRSRKRKREKKKKKRRRRQASSDSRAVQMAQQAERPASQDVVDEARPIHTSADPTEDINATETHYLS